MFGFRGSNVTKTRHVNHASHWYMSELTHRIVAESGIPDDQYHLGKIILQSLKDDPQFVMQIDGAAGEAENYDSVLKRSVRCANGLRKLGVKTGDVMILMAPNHLDLAIPFYAALYLGISIAPIDIYLRVNELEDTFRIDNPRIIFCQNERLPDVIDATKGLDLKPDVITFDKGEQVLNFTDFLENYGNDVSFEHFRPSDFDPSAVISVLLSTSGTTGKPKSAAISHRSFALSAPFLWSYHTVFPTPTRLYMVVSPLQWLSAVTCFIIGPIMRYTRLQSPLRMTQEHTYHLINKYRPSYMLMSPTMLTTIIKSEERDKCDFTCLDVIFASGSALHKNLIEEVKKVTPKTCVYNIYAMSETTTAVFYHDNSPPESCGKPFGLFQYRLVDTTTGEDIHEPNVPGELRVWSPAIFTGYYNNSEATQATFDNGWLKTGDLFYRDENWNFYYVDRLKLLLKYKNYQIAPVEVEGVIKQHPNVLDVAVVGIPDPECGDLAVACVVPMPGQTVTAQEIKDLVKSKLTDSKQLTGGVVFLSEIPLTSTAKPHRRILKEIVLNSPRE